jgi:heme/copper-type cytochrome/quinol oxidase subunit 4
MEPASLAAKRYRIYKQEKRKESLKQQVISFILKVLEAIARLLKKTGVIRRKVETVRVE